MNINKYKYLALTLILPIVSYAQEAATSVSDVPTANSVSDIKMGWTDLVVFILCLIPALFIAKPFGWILGVIPWDGQRAVGKGCGTLLAWPFVAAFMLVLIKEILGF